MKKFYDAVMKNFDQEKANGKVWVEYHESLEDLLADNVDIEVLDETWFVWGSEEKPSELQEPFIMVDVTGATMLPIFTANRKDDLVTYLRGSHKKYWKGK